MNHLKILVVVLLASNPVWGREMMHPKTPAMTGEFSGTVSLILLDRHTVEGWVPADLRPFVDLKPGNDRSLQPVVIMIGEQRNVGVQVVREMRHFEMLKYYPEALIMIPNLELKGNHNQGQLFFTFARIFVGDEWVAARGGKLNKSPKKYAEFATKDDGTDVLYEDKNILSLHYSVSADQRWNEQPLPQDHIMELRKIFSQQKIEAIGTKNYAIYDFDFMASLSELRAANDGALDIAVRINRDLAWQSVPQAAKKMFTDQPSEYYFKGTWRKNVTFVKESR